MEMEQFEGYTYVNGGVCAAKGFKANGLNCGLNSDKNKNDLALVVSDTECNTAAVYTTNKVKGAPILVTKKHLAVTNNKAKAVRLSTLDAICKALDCQPGDILEYVEDGEETKEQE